jgi:hypothetical protein
MFTWFIQSLDVDLAAGSKGVEHLYPPPLTGHDLMALFPPAPPPTLEKKPMSTSSLFRQEERAFFSRDTITRAQMVLPSKAPTPSHPHSQHHSSAIPILLSSSQRSPIRPPHPSYQRGQHMTRVDTAPPNREIKNDAERSTQDNPDEAWRRPMPHSERRRAGKHTKRIIIRTWWSWELRKLAEDLYLSTTVEEDMVAGGWSIKEYEGRIGYEL